MDYFKKNISALERTSPALAKRLQTVQPAAAEAIKTPSGELSVRLLNAGGRPYTLASTVNPLREARRLVESQYTGTSNTALVYGFGLGYHLEYLLEKMPERAAVLVVEPQINIFRLVLSLRDLSWLLGRDNLYWAVGEDATQVSAHFGELFRVASLDGVTIISHHPSINLCGAYFNILDQLCHNWIVAIGGNFLTNVSAVKTYQSNTLENILSVVNHPPIRTLYDRFRKVPGLVISAGPSLDRNIDLLPLMERHALLICVDTALRPLVRSGVRPHLVLAGDSSEWNYKHLRGLGESGAALVAEPMTHPKILSEFVGPKFIMSFNEVLMRKMAEVLGDFGVIKAWGSISTGAFDLARRLGCDPIVFIGQDLSFPGGRYYAHGTYQEPRWLREMVYPLNLDHMHRRRTGDENNLEARDLFGRPVKTSKVLKAYSQYLEREISETTARVINATEGGLGFEGVENMPLEEVLWRFARKERNLRTIIDSAHSRRTDPEISSLLQFLERHVERLDQICELCNQGFELARCIHQDKSAGSETDLKQMEKIYEKIFNEKEILVMLENANQAGLLTFQRGCEKLKGQPQDRDSLSEAARLYGAFFISFYQTASFLRPRFEEASSKVEKCLHGSDPDSISGQKDILRAG